MRQINSLVALLILGVSMIIGSLPLFFLHHVIVVSHQAYRGGPSSTEFIGPAAGKIYGCFFLLIGLTFIYLYIRVRRAS